MVLMVNGQNYCNVKSKVSHQGARIMSGFNVFVLLLMCVKNLITRKLITMYVLCDYLLFFTTQQNPNTTIMVIFSTPTQDIQCTAQSEHSIVTSLYQCINGTGVQVKGCRRIQSTRVGRASANCTVTVEADIDNQNTFYCLETQLNDPEGQLSSHYSISVLSG